jgi:hypothetical protein
VQVTPYSVGQGREGKGEAGYTDRLSINRRTRQGTDERIALDVSICSDLETLTK